MLHHTDILTTAIIGPWASPTSSESRRQQVYPTLAHWFEAAKFVPHRPELRDLLLDSASIKELRRFARARQSLWRPDWPIARHAVLVSGLGMLTLQRPELGLRHAPLDTTRQGLSPLELPEAFLDECLKRYEQWRQGPRVCVFGADTAPPAVVGARLAKLVTPVPNWTLVSTCNRRTAWDVHDWALTHHVPVDYLGGPDERSRRSLANSLVETSDHVVVFEQRRQKRFDHVLQATKAAKRKLLLELYDADGLAGGQLSLA